jgi:hypothetical protein
VREEIELLKYEPHLPANLVQHFQLAMIVCAGFETMLANADFAFVECLQAVDAAKERALAPARWANNDRDLAFVHIESDPAKHHQRAMPLVQILDSDHAANPVAFRYQHDSTARVRYLKKPAQ